MGTTLTILERSLKLNIAWEMASCQQGFVLEKVNVATSRGAPRQEPRFVALFPNDMQIKWAKASGSEKLVYELRRQKRQSLAPEQLAKLKLHGLPALPEIHALCKEGNLGRFPRWSVLELHDVVRIDYGIMNRACILANEDPWRCFSLVTLKRSFDFICPDEECVQCWVLAISRLAHW